MTMYVLTVDGNVISEPMTQSEIFERFGSIQKLESSGVRLVEVKNEKVS